MDVFGTILIGADEGLTGVESGSGTTQLDAPHFLLVGQFTDAVGDFRVSNNRSLVPYDDPDDGSAVTVGQTVAAIMDHPFDQDRFILDLVAGETIYITVDSVNFDPYLDVVFPGVQAEELFSDDDSGGGIFGLNAKLTYRAPHTGTYFILVNDANFFDVGGYFLTIAQAPAGATPVNPAPIAGEMAQARSAPGITLLSDGRVLVTGGVSDFGAIASVEVYDPSSGTFVNAGRMATPRARHTATLLTDGRVLVARGVTTGEEIVASAEVFDPSTDSWSPVGAMTHGRPGHAAALLSNGNVLVAGGFTTGDEALASAELFDPSTGSWSPAGAMTEARLSNMATVLPDGRVLIVGGFGVDGFLASAEVYDPTTDEWSSASTMMEARLGHTVSLLSDGRVLVVGGFGVDEFLASAEVYDPTTGMWSSPSGVKPATMRQSRGFHTATLLPDGRVLVAGGFFPTLDEALASAEVYDPSTNTWSSTTSLSQARATHDATLIGDRRVLVAGGSDGISALASAEVYDPVTGAWSSAAETTQMPLLARAREEGLRVGFVQEDPFGYINEAGECTGFDIEITREAAKRVGIGEIICVYLAWPGLIPGLLADRIDIIPVGMSIQPARCEVAAFTDPYQTYGTGAMVLSGNPKNIHSINDFAERDDIIIALAIGTPQIEAIQAVGVPDDQILLFPEQIQQIDAVRTGRADALLTNTTFINSYILQEGTDELERAIPFEYPVARNSGHVFRPSDEEAGFVDMWNDILREMKLDGTIKKIGEQFGWTDADLLDPDVTREGCCSGEFNDNVGCTA